MGFRSVQEEQCQQQSFSSFAAQFHRCTHTGCGPSLSSRITKASCGITVLALGIPHDSKQIHHQRAANGKSFTLWIFHHQWAADQLQQENQVKVSKKKKSAPFTSALFLQFNRKMLAVLFSGPQCRFLLRTYFSAEVFCFGCLGDLGSGGGGVVFCMCVCLLGKEF